MIVDFFNTLKNKVVSSKKHIFVILSLILVSLIMTAPKGHASIMLAEFDNASSASQTFTNTGVGMAFGLYYGTLNRTVGNPITSISGDAFVGFNAVYTSTGQYDFNAVNSSRFTEFVSFLTNGMDDTLWRSAFTFTAIDTLTVPSISGGGPESSLFPPSNDLNGNTIDFIRLIVNDVSVTNDGFSQSSEWDVTWQFWGESLAVPEPSTLFLVGTGLMGLAGLRRKLKKS